MDLNPAKHRELLQQAPILAGLSVGRCETGLIQDALETLALIHQLEDAKRQYPNHRWIAGLFEDRDASAFRQLFGNSCFHILVHWEDAWNACCPLIVKLQKTIQLLLHGRWVFTYLFRIVRSVLG